MKHVIRSAFIIGLAVSLSACGPGSDGNKGSATGSGPAQSTSDESKDIVQDVLDSSRDMGGEAVDQAMEEVKAVAGDTFDQAKDKAGVAVADAQAKASDAAKSAMDSAVDSATESGLESAKQAIGEDALDDPAAALKGFKKN